MQSAHSAIIHKVQIAHELQTFASSHLKRSRYMRKSCIVFQKAKLDAELHNSRSLKTEAHYLLPQEFRQKNDFQKYADLHEVYDENMHIRTEKRMRGKAPSLKDNFYDAVVVLETHHTLDDVKKLADFISEKYHFTYTSVAIHRDEGHVNADHSVDYNYHAHICFVTLKNGQATKRLLKRSDLQNLQTECAEILHMQRGEKDSKAVRLEHDEYRYMKQQENLAKVAQVEKDIKTISDLRLENKSLSDSLNAEKSVNSIYREEILTLKDQKAQIEAERKKYKESRDYIADEYRKLQALNRERYTQEQLNEKLNELRRAHEEKIKKLLAEHKKEIEQKNQEVNEALQCQGDLKKEIEVKKQEISEAKVNEIRLKTQFSLKNYEKDKTIKTLQDKVLEKDAFIAQLQKKLDEITKRLNELSRQSASESDDEAVQTEEQTEKQSADDESAHTLAMIHQSKISQNQHVKGKPTSQEWIFTPKRNNADLRNYFYVEAKAGTAEFEAIKNSGAQLIVNIYNMSRRYVFGMSVDAIKALPRVFASSAVTFYRSFTDAMNGHSADKHELIEKIGFSRQISNTLNEIIDEQRTQQDKSQTLSRSRDDDDEENSFHR